MISVSWQSLWNAWPHTPFLPCRLTYPRPCVPPFPFTQNLSPGENIPQLLRLHDKAWERGKGVTFLVLNLSTTLFSYRHNWTCHILICTLHVIPSTHTISGLKLVLLTLIVPCREYVIYALPISLTPWNDSIALASSCWEHTLRMSPMGYA